MEEEAHLVRLHHGHAAAHLAELRSERRCLGVELVDPARYAVGSSGLRCELDEVLLLALRLVDAPARRIDGRELVREEVVLARHDGGDDSLVHRRVREQVAHGAPNAPVRLVAAYRPAALAAAVVVVHGARVGPRAVGRHVAPLVVVEDSGEKVCRLLGAAAPAARRAGARHGGVPQLAALDRRHAVLDLHAGVGVEAAVARVAQQAADALHVPGAAADRAVAGAVEVARDLRHGRAARCRAVCGLHGGRRLGVRMVPPVGPA
ncbi:hypothetical protein H6A22_10060 [Collinsella intestinalis]|nr:hypothetical protein [Collinsella intestinalis]MBM6943413.1 hypothetical protein [Collinsella intestinalis]